MSFYCVYPPVGGTPNASVGTNGVIAPTSATEVAGINPSGNLQPLQTDVTGALITVPATGSVQHVIVDSSALPTGASTSALQTSGNASLTSIDSKLTSPLAVTGPLTDAQLRAVAVPVSGAFFPATQAVSGTVNINSNYTSHYVSGSGNGVLLGAQDVNTYSELQFSLIGTFVANVAIEISLDNFYYFPVNIFSAVAQTATTTVSTAGLYFAPLGGRYFRVVISGYVSGTVAFTTFVPAIPRSGGGLNLVPGVATQATLATVKTDTASIVTNTGVTATNVSSGNTLIGPVTEVAPATDTASSGLNGRLQRIAQRLTSLLALFPTTLGQGTMATSLRVVLPSDQSTLTVSATNLSTNLAQVNGITPLTGNGVTGTGSLRVTLASDTSTNTNPLLVNEIRSSTAALANVISSATTVNLLAANAARKGAAIYNDSTANLYLKLGATASITSFTVLIQAGGYYELPATSVYTGVVDGIWASANGNARVTELS